MASGQIKLIGGIMNVKAGRWCARIQCMEDGLCKDQRGPHRKVRRDAADDLLALRAAGETAADGGRDPWAAVTGEAKRLKECAALAREEDLAAAMQLLDIAPVSGPEVREEAASSTREASQ